MKTNQEIINELAGRDDLTKEQILQLTDARRSSNGDTDKLTVCGWAIEISHHIHTGGHWSAEAWHAGSSCFSGERAVSGNDTEAACWAKVANFLLFATANPR